MTMISPKNKRSFRPIKIGDSLNKINQKFLHKFGKLNYTIQAKWLEIVGPFFFQHSEPNKITSIPVSSNEIGDLVYKKYLHVNVTPSAAIEFQHFQNKIIEKINSYFGYQAIEGIKINQQLVKTINTVSKKNIVSILNKNQKEEEIKKITPSMNDKNLEQSIVNLGISIKNKRN